MSEQDAGRAEEVVRYRISSNVNPIQARKAWEDEDTWAPALVASHVGDVVEVLLLSASDLDGLSGGLVWVTERWGVLAIVDEGGNAIAIRDLDEMPRSVFARAGSSRLRFISATRVLPSDEHAEPDAPEEIGQAI